MAEEKNNIAIDLKGISKKYKLYANKTDRMKEALSFQGKQFHKEFYALSKINLQVQKGEILGIVGKNGSGKSTLLKIISGILQPSTGSVKTSGRIIPLLELGSGFNPEFTGLENIYFYNSFLGFSRKETEERLQDIIDFADIGDFLYQPLKTYSSGMKSRLAFAVSINVNPDILILDEILAVGDELFRRKCYAKMTEIFDAGKTILFVSHNLESIKQICTRAIFLNKGEIKNIGSSKEIFVIYKNFLFGTETKSTNSSNETKIKFNTDSNNKDKQKITKRDFFVENYTSKSSVITSNKNIEIHSPELKDVDENIVNHICKGNKYNFSIYFKSNQDESNLQFGFALKTEKGIDINWKMFPGRNEFYKKAYKANEYHKLTFSFDCNMFHGNYYISIVIRKQNENEADSMVVLRAEDLFVFNVINENIRGIGGLVDLNINITNA